MAQLRVREYSTETFTFDPVNRVLIAEASDMQFRSFERLYDDAIDVGLALKSHKTGAVTRWYHADTLLDPNHDVQVWILKPTPETLRKHASLEGNELHILND